MHAPLQRTVRPQLARDEENLHRHHWLLLAGLVASMLTGTASRSKVLSYDSVNNINRCCSTTGMPACRRETATVVSSVPAGHAERVQCLQTITKCVSPSLQLLEGPAQLQATPQGRELTVAEHRCCLPYLAYADALRFGLK